jgi:uncharacterized membrane protein YeaQ/YmgE (transglycosylase-associated protein family)
MGIIVRIVVGLVAAALARVIVPGRRDITLLRTLRPGLGGAPAGGVITSAAGTGDVDGSNVWSMVLAVAAAGALLLFVQGLVRGDRDPRTTA